MKKIMSPTFTVIAVLLTMSTQAFAAPKGTVCEARVVSNNHIEAQETFETTLGNYRVDWKDYSEGGKIVGNYAVFVTYEASGKTAVYVSRKLGLFERFTNELAPVGGGGGAKFESVDSFKTVLDAQNNFAILTAVDQDRATAIQVKCALKK